MICSPVNLYFKSNLLLHGIGLKARLLLNFWGTSANGLPRDELIPIHSSFSECIKQCQILFSSKLFCWIKPCNLHLHCYTSL